MTERQLQTKVMRNLKRMLGVCARVHRATPFSTTGDPDIYGCINGRMFQIELKLPGKKLTEIQIRRLKEWSDAGALAIVATSWEEIEPKLLPLSNE